MDKMNFNAKPFVAPTTARQHAPQAAPAVAHQVAQAPASLGSDKRVSSVAKANAGGADIATGVTAAEIRMAAAHFAGLSGNVSLG